MLDVILIGLLMGLGGSLHCVGMCGAIVTAFSFNQKGNSLAKNTVQTVTYNFGRASTYILLGLLFGWLGHLGAELGLLKILRVFAGVLMVATGFYVAGFFTSFTKIEVVGKTVWRHVQPLLAKLDPKRSYLHSYFAGMIWGLIPCGLVYAAIGVALGQGSVQNSVVFMLFFGVGTMLPLILLGIGFSHMANFMRKPVVRYLLASGMIVFGSYTLVTLYLHQQHNHATHQQSKMHETNQMKDNTENTENQHHHHH